MKFLPDAFADAWNTPNSAAATSANTTAFQNFAAKPTNVSSQPLIQPKQNVLQPQPQVQNVAPRPLTRQSIPSQPLVQNVTSQPQSISKQNILYQPQAQVRQNVSVQPRQNVAPQDQTQARQKSVIQPARPAPPVTASLRTVAPSRYPPVSHSTTSKSKENNPLLNLPRIVVPNATPNTNSHSNVSPNILCNMNSNTNALNTEPVHRYEEIPDSTNSGQNTHSSATSRKNTSNILDEFDPYSMAKGTEMYDNVPDNMNSIYNTHRYEDIPDDSYYEEIPNEAKPSESEEVSFLKCLINLF